ncbi:hypothetical protein KC19_2G125800 [Ceratodon purpureus]|uniref:RRM domain-containing protein n=1 Tax=Ceratodon purpureus TaxID=3225 RepID=A0A8T0IT62_CERPU|nr:hypothetical protein KC19_2G125800 [Ceratodon purpureus]
MSNTQHRASRCVFVGNIPYDATEEQLVHICEEVGPVVNFRLVLDRETGKPKGYGFCEFRDEETALSARRNLQGYEINGRQLRVDFAENEKGGGGDRNREQRQGGQGQQPGGFDPQRQSGTRQVVSNIEPDRSGEPPIGQATAVAAAQFLTGTLGGQQQPQQQQQQYGVSMNGQSMPVANGTAATAGNDQLTSHLAGMSKQQLFEVMVQMKTMIQQNQQQARQVLMANPQLTKAIFQAQIMLGMVRPPQMNQAMLPTQQQQQQRAAVPPAPTNLMQQPPLPPQPRPVQPPVIPGQVQQPMNYQPQQIQQPLPQATFQHQGGMVQQSSGMSMSYVQQGPAPPSQPPPQPQYQMLQQNSRMDGSSGAPSIGQAGMVSGSEAVLPTGQVMGPGGIPQMGRNMNMPQAGQLGSMGPGAPMNQPSPPSGPGIPGQVMHGLVMGAAQPMGSGNQPLLNTGVPVSSGPSLIGASLVSDNQSRPNYGNQAGISDGGVSSASPMQPHPYGQMPMQSQVPQQQPPQMAGELEQQKALLQQVLSLTPEQINSLPPEQRQQVLQLQQALRT